MPWQTYLKSTIALALLSLIAILLRKVQQIVQWHITAHSPKFLYGKYYSLNNQRFHKFSARFFLWHLFLFHFFSAKFQWFDSPPTGSLSAFIPNNILQAKLQMLLTVWKLLYMKVVEFKIPDLQDSYAKFFFLCWNAHFHSVIFRTLCRRVKADCRRHKTEFKSC